MKSIAHLPPVSLLAVSLALLLPVSAIAASQCKGMAQTDCAGTEQCRWVDSYVRKDGREVNGYCRTLRTRNSPQPPALKKGNLD